MLKTLKLKMETMMRMRTTLHYTTLHYTVVEDGDNDEDENYTGEILSL